MKRDKPRDCTSVNNTISISFHVKLFSNFFLFKDWNKLIQNLNFIVKTYELDIISTEKTRKYAVINCFINQNSTISISESQTVRYLTRTRTCAKRVFKDIR